MVEKLGEPVERHEKNIKHVPLGELVKQKCSCTFSMRMLQTGRTEDFYNLYGLQGSARSIRC